LYPVAQARPEGDGSKHLNKANNRVMETSEQLIRFCEKVMNDPHVHDLTHPKKDIAEPEKIISNLQSGFKHEPGGQQVHALGSGSYFIISSVERQFSAGINEPERNVLFPHGSRTG
jgi:hypothetical protein